MIFFEAEQACRRGDERWTPLKRAKNDAFWALASLALAATRPLPLPALRWLGRNLGAIAHAVASHARGTALANVTRVFSEFDEGQRRAFVRLCFTTLGELLGETVALLHPNRAPPPIQLCESARALFEQARAEGRGVIFASAHLGPWERVAGSLVAAGVPLVALARESYDPRFSGLYARLRAAHGVRFIWRASPGAAASILRTLRAGGVLGVPMDLRARVASVDAPFLGHDAPTAIGPARIALRTGAAVIVGTAAPASAPVPSHTPHLESSTQAEMVVTATRIATADLPPGPEGARLLTGRINGELSHRILAFPHAWVWMHERWPGPARV
jgi:Kdo2-lipid IVA lauroyltransferase/acyltransferase